MRRVVVAGLVLLVVGCAPPDSKPSTAPPEQTPTVESPTVESPTVESPTGRATPSPSPSPTPSPTPVDPSYSTWKLGARPLPLRPDGYGEVRPTPPTLRERRYPTADRLPPPSGGRFASTIDPIGREVRRRMGTTYSAGCPVSLGDLRYLTVSFRGYDGAAHTGELVVAASEARDVVSVFRTLYAADFPIEEMRLPGTADLEAPPTGDGNDTAAFVCRATTGQTSGFSAHAYGLAIDVNPFVNPYLKGDLVLPELATSYLDRSRRRPGMVLDDDLVVRAFARIGWSWGGDFSSLKDYQHFTATGR